MYVAGPALSAIRGAPLSRVDPDLYRDDYPALSDELGFSFKSIGKAISRGAKAAVKPLAKITGPALKTATGFLPGGNIMQAGINLVSGKKAPRRPVIRAAVASVPAVIAAKPVAVLPKVSPVIRMAKPTAPLVVPVKSDSVAVAKRVLAAGTAAKAKSNKIADQVRKIAGQVEAVSKAAASAAAAGDELGARRFAEQARQLEQIAAQVQSGASMGAGMIQQAGAAAQGAAAGGVAAAGAEGARQGISGFLATTEGKIVAGLSVIGVGILWRGLSGGGRSYRPPGSSSSSTRQWE